MSDENTKVVVEKEAGDENEKQEVNIKVKVQ